MTACTEKEAAERWCPHARVAWCANPPQWVAANRGWQLPQPGDMTQCMGSRCMQWRWSDTETSTYTVFKDFEFSEYPSSEEALSRFLADDEVKAFVNLGFQPHENGPCPAAFNKNKQWSLTLFKPRGDTRRGYCGLAGQP